MSLTNPPIPATIVPRRSIGQFNATLTIEENASDDLEITQHPVQQGASITDHAFMKPVSVSVKVLFNEETAPLREIYEKMRKLQNSREPFDVVTGKREYKNMLIKSLGQTNDVLTENVLSLNLELQEIIITTIETTTVPARSKQANPGKTGKTENAGEKKAQQETKNPEKKRSALKILAGG